MYQRNINLQGNKGAQNYQNVQQQTLGIMQYNSAKIGGHAYSNKRSDEHSPRQEREPKYGKESGFVDNFKTNICKDQAKRLIFSNSNAILESGDVKQNNDKAKKNLDILNTNHHYLVDHQITSSNMIASHNNSDNDTTGQAIHVNDQSMEKEQNYDYTRTDDLAASSPTIETQNHNNDMYRFGKHSGALIVASATSDFSQVSEAGGDADGTGGGEFSIN